MEPTTDEILKEMIRQLVEMNSNLAEINSNLREIWKSMP